LTGWRELAASLGLVIVGGFCECDDGGLPRNSAAIIDVDGTLTIYRKAHLWDREQLLFVAGSEAPPVVVTAVGRIGVAVCYDAFFPEVMRSLALAGADLIAVPMNSPVIEPPGRTQPLPVEIVLALAAANANRVFVAQADRIGSERGIEWAGASVICDPDGRLLAGPVADLERPAMLTATCDPDAARDKRLGARNDVFADRRLDLYRDAATTHQTKETVN
jgi:predicted amidohydrolase